MTIERQQFLLDLCHEQIAKIYYELCRERKFEVAAQARKVMKNLIDLSNMLGGEEDEQ